MLSFLLLLLDKINFDTILKTAGVLLSPGKFFVFAFVSFYFVLYTKLTIT